MSIFTLLLNYCGNLSNKIIQRLCKAIMTTLVGQVVELQCLFFGHCPNF